jgi:hypothetical protein
MGDPVNSVNSVNQRMSAPSQTYVNQKGLTENNLVYVAGEGRNLVAADTQVGVDQHSSSPFVQTSSGELGIYHATMLQQFKSQYKPRDTGNAQTDKARQEFDFCNYVTDRYLDKSDQVLTMLKSQPKDQQDGIRAFLNDIEERAKAEAERLGLSAEDTKDYVNQQTFKALGEKYKGTELGDRSREAYALNNYSKDALKFTSAKYGLPEPGQQNPYNTQGQQNRDYGSSIQDQAILQQIQRMQVLQFLTLMSLFNNCGMGFNPMMMAPWMR